MAKIRAEGSEEEGGGIERKGRKGKELEEILEQL